MKIVLLTFLRQNEILPSALLEFFLFMKNNSTLDVSCVLAADSSCTNRDSYKPFFTKIFLSDGDTKYLRIYKVMNTIDFDWILCIDSDITPNTESIIHFLQEAISKNADTAWGIITCGPTHTIVSHLVLIDKVLSHYWIRPILWKLQLGISIPGQIMFIKKSTFFFAYTKDTFLDDVALGIFIRSHLNQLTIYRENTILGIEKPSQIICQLLSQRRRWANGYASLLCQRPYGLVLLYVLIHGFTYHCILPILTCSIIVLFYFQPIYATIAFLLFTLFLSGGNLCHIIVAMLYPFIFSYLHIWWLFCVLYYISKNTYNVIFGNQ